jgi:hypothetical protein
MSVANKQITHLRALDLNKRTITADATIRTGRPTDNFVIDNPVELNPTAATAVTLPSGYKIGQTILISFQGGDTTAVTLTVTNHANGDGGTATLNADDEYLFMMWTGTEWVTVSYGGCDDVAAA